jgi:beta-mannosidase
MEKCKMFFVLSCLLTLIAFGDLQAKPSGPVFDLNGKWRLFFGQQNIEAPETPEELSKSAFREIPAIVPGNVEIDLMNAGILPDISHGTNIYLVHPYETYTWWYFRKFESPLPGKNERLELVFEGLDCIANIWLNGQKVGHAENMLITHRFDVTGFLKPGGDNELYVQINSALLEGRKYELSPFQFAFDGNWESLNVRKAPHSYGWDIMPRIISAGIWRDVYLEKTNSSRFRSVYWGTAQVDLGNKTASLYLDYDFVTDVDDFNDLQVKVNITKDNKAIYGETFPVVSSHGQKVISLKDVDFWWPRGYGEQPLYEAALILQDKQGHILADKKDKIGIRTLRLIRSEIVTPEVQGEFVFVVNGEKIFAKGTNWVPLDGLHSRDKQHLDKMFEMLVDLNCNMVRCWGGNVYEDDAFYDLCDKNGIMVWQDFSFGCARYPQDDKFAAKIEEEANSIVRKFRNRPSLAIWAGNNENDVSLNWTIDLTQHDPNLDRISRQILPGVVRDQDPLRDYLPSSPYMSPEVFKAGSDQNMMPEVHLWGPRGYYKAEFYTRVSAHFVSEIGYHGCPDRSSIERMMDGNFVEPDYKNRKWNEQWQAKAVVVFPDDLTKISTKRNDLMPNQVEALFGTLPDKFDDFIFASQVTQAEAKKFFIELWRSQKFSKTGILWWNLRDGWPILSDAIVDYYFNKKLAYDYIRRVQTNVCAMITDAKEGKHPVVLVNDTRKPAHGKVVVTNADTNKELFNSTFDVEANGKEITGYIPETGTQEMWLIRYETEDGKQHVNHYLCGKPPFKLDDYKRWFKKLDINNNWLTN